MVTMYQCSFPDSDGCIVFMLKKKIPWFVGDTDKVSLVMGIRVAIYTQINQENKVHFSLLSALV